VEQLPAPMHAMTKVDGHGPITSRAQYTAESVKRDRKE